MAVPSENFDAPTAAEIQVNKPNKSSIQVKIRESLIHLEEWLGLDFTAAQNHNHDNVNSASVAIGGSFTWLAAPVTKVTLSAGAVTNIAYTDIDISAQTGGDTAKIGIFQITGIHDETVVSDVNFQVKMRKNGTALDDPDVPQLGDRSNVTGGTGAIVTRIGGQLFVELDGSEICEYSVVATGTGSSSSLKIVLIAYLV